MGNISKSFSLLLILILAVSSLTAIFSTLPFGLAQSGTNVSYIITQDSTWTPAGSPYTLTGDTLVYQGVTLTIEPGVTVNLGSHYIEVNGTLSAIGSPSDKVNFNGGQITFTTSSNGWSEQTDSGCLIENANIDQTSISSSNPLKIDSSNINGQVSVTSSIITNNIITGAISGANSTISNNNVIGDITMQASPAIGSYPSESSVISNNVVTGDINVGYFDVEVSGDSSTVFNNTVNGSISSVSGEGAPEIYNNTVSNGGIGCAGYGSIFNNCIYGCQDGISLSTPRGFGGNLYCFATVENNLIIDNTQGIDIELTSTFGPGTACPTILNNTISDNSVGIYLSENYYNATPTIQYNNLQNNSNYNFNLVAPNNIDATYNWWGTNNQSAISNSIYDYNQDFTLGKVTYTPFLTAPNSQAPNPNTPIPTPAPTSTQSTAPPSHTATLNLTSSSSPSPSPSLLPIELTVTGVVAIVIVAVAVGTFLLGKRAERNSKRTADYQT
jgi:hypothetical protein